MVRGIAAGESLTAVMRGIGAREWLTTVPKGITVGKALDTVVRGITVGESPGSGRCRGPGKRCGKTCRAVVM